MKWCSSAAKWSGVVCVCVRACGEEMDELGKGERVIEGKKCGAVGICCCRWT